VARRSESPKPDRDRVLELRLLRHPSDEDRSQLRAVFFGAPAYALLTEGKLPSDEHVDDFLTALPPGCKAETKYPFAVCLGPAMIGCADLIRGWPKPDTCHIGLLLLAETYQGRGLGTSAFGEIERVASTWSEIRRLRIAVVDANRMAFPFWERLGFAATGSRLKNSTFVSDVVVMERSL